MFVCCPIFIYTPVSPTGFWLIWTHSLYLLPSVLNVLRSAQHESTLPGDVCLGNKLVLNKAEGLGPSYSRSCWVSTWFFSSAREEGGHAFWEACHQDWKVLCHWWAWLWPYPLAAGRANSIFPGITLGEIPRTGFALPPGTHLTFMPPRSPLPPSSSFWLFTPSHVGSCEVHPAAALLSASLLPSDAASRSAGLLSTPH